MIVVTGMPGAGKDEFVQIARSFGMKDVHMGDTVKTYARRTGVNMTDRDIGSFATAERKNLGMDIWAKRTGESISDPDRTIVDGLRNTEELEYFRNNFNNVRVVAIYANKHDRLDRIMHRNRVDDIKSENELDLRDGRELSWGIGKTISLADYMIINDGTLEEFRAKSREFMEKIMSEQ
ncbi:MAG: flagellar hook-basal body complex protein FliE [Candidatus Thermoplasmatota archaeon]|nr:flagellar hook-basal body complex protein FliE [Candidatus Thermoplasmatota archaeon]